MARRARLSSRRRAHGWCGRSRAAGSQAAARSRRIRASDLSACRGITARPAATARRREPRDAEQPFAAAGVAATASSSRHHSVTLAPGPRPMLQLDLEAAASHSCDQPLPAAPDAGSPPWLAAPVEIEEPSGGAGIARRAHRSPRPAAPASDPAAPPPDQAALRQQPRPQGLLALLRPRRRARPRRARRRRGSPSAYCSRPARPRRGRRREARKIGAKALDAQLVGRQPFCSAAKSLLRQIGPGDDMPQGIAQLRQRPRGQRRCEQRRADRAAAGGHQHLVLAAPIGGKRAGDSPTT